MLSELNKLLLFFLQCTGFKCVRMIRNNFLGG